MCTDCLVTAITALWPRDVEPKLEACGPHISFLHLEIQAAPRSIWTNEVTFRPLITNDMFCKGLSLYPSVAKCPQYINWHVHGRRQWEAVLWGKFAITVYTCRENLATAQDSVICNMVEPILLGWCPKMVAEATANFPKTYRNATANLIRLCGQHLKRSRDAARAWSYLEGTAAWIDFPWYFLLKSICSFVVQRMRTTGAALTC